MIRWRSSLRIEVISADLSSMLERIVSSGVQIYRTELLSELTARISIGFHDFEKLRNICENSGARIKVCEKEGIHWIAKGALSRPALLLCCAFLILLTIFIPGRIFFVHVEGNQAVETRKILEAAERAGVAFGASRRDVRSEKVKNRLLELIPQLQWAGINTSGCVAKISVRERNEEAVQEETLLSGNIVAVRDGLIISCTATRGNLLCAVGQTVSEGEILISGYTDCGIVIQATQAAGEVFAQTERKINVVLPLEKSKQGAIKKESVQISLLVGKKRIFLWKDSGIWDITCDRIYEECYAILPGGYRLPVALAVDICQQRDIYKREGTREAYENWVSEFASQYLVSHMVAGTVLSSEENFENENGCLLLTGQYVCTEMIGMVQKEEIGAKHGETG